MDEGFLPENCSRDPRDVQHPDVILPPCHQVPFIGLGYQPVGSHAHREFRAKIGAITQLKHLVAPQGGLDRFQVRQRRLGLEPARRVQVDFLAGGGLLSPAAADRLEELCRRSQALTRQRFGKVIGSEFILERSAGESLLKIVQIQKFEKHAMRWTFLFYSADGQWVLNACTFDDKIQTVFEE